MRLQMMQCPAMFRAIQNMYTCYGKDAVSLTELRKMLDKEMGQKTLTEELYALREWR